MKSEFEHSEISIDELLNCKTFAGFQHLKESAKRRKEFKPIKLSGEMPKEKIRVTDALFDFAQELKLVTQTCICCGNQVTITGQFVTIQKSELDHSYRQMSFATERDYKLPLQIVKENCFVPICAECPEVKL